MMHGILCRCRATALSFNALRCRSKSIGSLQNHRNISTAAADLFSYSNVDKSKNEASENQPDCSLTTENNKDNVNSSTLKSPVWSQFSTIKYERFDESSTHIIYDFDEEQKRLEEGLDIIEKEREKVEEEIHIERGVRGVFDIEELVDLLREGNAQDIVVMRIPKHMRYVEHMVIVSCKSQRHLNSVAQIVLKIYKKKKRASDRSCIMEGKNTGWVALDMGNIALHLMEPELREDYDIETLWTVGAEFDDLCQKERESDPLDLINFDIRGVGALNMQTSAEINHDSSSLQQLK